MVEVLGDPFKNDPVLNEKAVWVLMLLVYPDKGGSKRSKIVTDKLTHHDIILFRDIFKKNR